MQSSPTPGSSAWWQQQSGQPQGPAAPAWATATPAQTTAPTAPAGLQWWERSKAPLGPSLTAAPVATAPTRPLDVRTLLHPSEPSRLALALSVSLLVFVVYGVGLAATGGSIELIGLLLALVALGASIWLSLQIARSRLLGGAVRVSDASLPELQAVFNQVRARLDYHKDVDVYVADKVNGGSAMTIYLGTRIIMLEGGLVAELLEEGHLAELTYLIGRHIGQLKARHERLQWILIVISLVDSLKFLQFFLAPYFRATAKSGDQIGAACCGDIQATVWMMNRLLVGKDLGPRVDIKGVLGQAVIVRSRILPRLAQMFQNMPHATNRYLNLLAFFARTAPDQINAWRATLDPATAGRLAAVLDTAPYRNW